MAHVEEAERYMNKMDDILDWADENTRYQFDTEFVDSVREQVERTGSISESQKNAINKIIDAFGVYR